MLSISIVWNTSEHVASYVEATVIGTHSLQSKQPPHLAQEESSIEFTFALWRNKKALPTPKNNNKTPMTLITDEENFTRRNGVQSSACTWEGGDSDRDGGHFLHLPILWRVLGFFFNWYLGTPNPKKLEGFQTKAKPWTPEKKLGGDQLWFLAPIFCLCPYSFCENSLSSARCCLLNLSKWKKSVVLWRM